MHRTPPDPPPPRAGSADAIEEVAPEVGSDAGSAEGAAGSRTPSPVAPQRPRANPEVAKLLAEAAEAQKAGNRLRQITRADAALRLDPRNARAKLLLADGLIASGDHDRGCKYLRDLGHNAAARARAKQAGCSTN